MSSAGDERWETGRGDGAGVYLVAGPKDRRRIADFGYGSVNGGSSAMDHRRANLAAAAPELLEALRLTAQNLSTLNAARVDAGIVQFAAWATVVEAAIAKAVGR